jgi:FkbM family methyltransferase
VIKTKHKIALAGALWRVIRLGYRLCHVSVKGQYRRGRINWNLDLDEGIDFAIFLFGHFEPGTVRFFQKRIRPGSVVLDIGANIGSHTLPLAQCVAPSGKVHAFEPTEFAFSKLLSNIALNPELAHLIVANHMFLSATQEENVPAQVYSSWPLIPTPGVHPKHLGRLQSTSGASAVTLDSYCREHRIERVDWIKLDVDGNEFTVLQGARETLSRCKPNIVMELSPYGFREAGQSFTEFVNYLLGFGYQIYQLENDRPLPSDPAKLDALVPDGAGINVLLQCPV